jgi:ferredoxin-fold anticodon binding domain-containing protein
VIAKAIRKRRHATMTNELIRKYIGKQCIVSTGSFGTVAVGQIVAVEDNWIEVITKKGSQLLNSDFVTNITALPDKETVK